MIDTLRLRSVSNANMATIPSGRAAMRASSATWSRRGEVATKQDIHDLRIDMRHEIGTLRGELRELEQRVRAGLLIAQTAVLVALLRFLPS